MMPRMTARSVAGTAASILVLLVCVGAVFALRHYVPSPADVMRTPFVREAAFNESVSLRTYELLARDVTVTKKVEMGSHTYVSPEVFVVVGLELSGGTTERKIGTIEAVSASGLRYWALPESRLCTVKPYEKNARCDVAIEVARKDLPGLKLEVAAAREATPETLDDVARLDLALSEDSPQVTSPLEAYTVKSDRL